MRTPSSYELISGGTALTEPETTGDGMTIRTEGALGLRDLSLLLTQDLTMVTADVDGVAVNVWGPADNEAATATVLDYAVSSQTSLVNAFGPYPWSEIDVVSAPLGSGVGGMEWPGMVWIESSIFAGGLPGLGSLTDTGLFPETGPDLGSIEDLISSGLFDELLAELPGGQALETSLEWTVAHELGHEWWHAVVGNDSVESPAVDEPLAQFAACVAMRDLHPENWRDICEAQTIDTYAQFEDPVWRGRCTSRTAIGCV